MSFKGFLLYELKLLIPDLDITGIDFIEIAIEKLKEIDSTLKVQTGDILALNFKNESFKYILAFGLYHNLEHGLEEALKESFRILEHGGSICASFRADNIQTKLTDFLYQKKMLPCKFIMIRSLLIRLRTLQNGQKIESPWCRNITIGG